MEKNILKLKFEINKRYIIYIMYNKNYYKIEQNDFFFLTFSFSTGFVIANLNPVSFLGSLRTSTSFISLFFIWLEFKVSPLEISDI
jgi:hypothetical protein